MFVKPFHSEFSVIEVWSTDQNSNPLDKIKITLVINLSIIDTKLYALRA